MLPLAIGAVVVGVPTTFHTPLSGDFVPVRAVVPIGRRVFGYIDIATLHKLIHTQEVSPKIPL